jgi:flagellar basal-body rod modification protein FlgD
MSSVAATTSTNTSYAAANGLSTSSNTDSTTASSDRFLKLLVTQMQNQDPLNPMDNAQVTSQMAQINTVNGIEKLNTTVQGLSGQFVQMQALQSAALMGRDVVVPGNRLDIASGVAQGGFELTSDASKVKVEVLSANGVVMDTLDLGAQKTGQNSFDWQAGTATNESGLTFRVTATDATGATLSSTALMRDRVDAVTTSGNTLNLELQYGGTVPYTSVRALN